MEISRRGYAKSTFSANNNNIKANSVSELGGMAEIWDGFCRNEEGAEEGSHNFCQQFWTAEADTVIK